MIDLKRVRLIRINGKIIRNKTTKKVQSSMKTNLNHLIEKKKRIKKIKEKKKLFDKKKVQYYKCENFGYYANECWSKK